MIEYHRGGLGSSRLLVKPLHTHFSGRYILRIILQVTTIVILMPFVRSPRSHATNTSKVINRIDPYPFKERNARANRLELEGRGFKSECLKKILFL